MRAVYKGDHPKMIRNSEYYLKTVFGKAFPVAFEAYRKDGEQDPLNGIRVSYIDFDDFLEEWEIIGKGKCKKGVYEFNSAEFQKVLKDKETMIAAAASRAFLSGADVFKAADSVKSGGFLDRYIFVMLYKLMEDQQKHGYSDIEAERIRTKLLSEYNKTCEEFYRDVGNFFERHGEINKQTEMLKRKIRFADSDRERLFFSVKCLSLITGDKNLVEFTDEEGTKYEEKYN